MPRQQRRGPLSAPLRVLQGGGRLPWVLPRARVGEACARAQVNNIIEIRGDAWKLCLAFQRPRWRPVEDVRRPSNPGGSHTPRRVNTMVKLFH